MCVVLSYVCAKLVCLCFATDVHMDTWSMAGDASCFSARRQSRSTEQNLSRIQFCMIFLTNCSFYFLFFWYFFPVFNFLIIWFRVRLAMGLRCLLMNSVFENVQAQEGCTALMLASGNGSSECVRLLLDAGASTKNPRGMVWGLQVYVLCMPYLVDWELSLVACMFSKYSAGIRHWFGQLTITIPTVCVCLWMPGPIWRPKRLMCDTRFYFCVWPMPLIWLPNDYFCIFSLICIMIQYSGCCAF